MSIDWNRPVQTRDGRAVTMVEDVPSDPEYPKRGVPQGCSGKSAWTLDGRYYAFGEEECAWDLVNVPEPEPTAADEWAVAHRTTRTDYTQPTDDCDESGDKQTLTVEVADAGSGPFLVISTERWALDKEDVPRFVELLMKALEECECD